VEHVGAVDVLDAPQDLIHKVLYVVVRERLGALEDLVEVGVHQLAHYVDVLELLVPAGRPRQVQDVDDVLVLEVPEQAQLAKGALGVREVLEDVGYFLDGDLFADSGVAGGADDGIVRETGRECMQ
jgi:hypothetical protein